MANLIELTIEMAKETANEGTYFHKLVGEGKAQKTFLGLCKGSKRTFYMFTDTLTEIGSKGEIDLDDFDQVPKDFDYVDEETGETKTAKLTYLYPIRD